MGTKELAVVKIECRGDVITSSVWKRISAANLLMSTVLTKATKTYEYDQKREHIQARTVILVIDIVKILIIMTIITNR